MVRPLSELSQGYPGTKGGEMYLPMPKGVPGLGEGLSQKRALEEWQGHPTPPSPWHFCNYYPSPSKYSFHLKTNNK